MSDSAVATLFAVLYETLSPEQKIIVDLILIEWEEACSEKLRQ